MDSKPEKEKQTIVPCYCGHRQSYHTWSRMDEGPRCKAIEPDGHGTRMCDCRDFLALNNLDYIKWIRNQKALK
jgi:hypothetical protein